MKEYFWHGLIETKANAEKIIELAGWVFVVFPFAVAAYLFIRHGLLFAPSALIVTLAFSPAFIVSAHFLSRKGSNAAARVLFVLMILAVVSYLIFQGSLIYDFCADFQGCSHPHVTGLRLGRVILLLLMDELVPLICMLVLTLLSWRAIKATTVLRKFNGEEGESIAKSEAPPQEGVLDIMPPLF